MSEKHFGMPGIGGSLGQCAVCGGDFLLEVLTGDTIITLEVAGCNQMLHCHNKCKKIITACKTFTDLPEASPLRKAYEDALLPKLPECANKEKT